MKQLFIPIIIVLGFLIPYAIHINDPGLVRISGPPDTIVSNPGYYPYPIHGDEWAHLSIAMHLIETESFPNINPYTGTERLNLQSGFHFFLGTLFASTKLDIIYFYQFLAPLFAVLTSLLIYQFVKEYTNNEYSGFFSAIFFLSIKSNINIMGTMFFVPHTFSFFLLISFIYLYYKKQTVLYFLVFLVSLLSYPMLSILLVIIYVLNEVINKNFNYKMLLLPIALMISALIYFKGDLNWIKNNLIFTPAWTEGNKYLFNILELAPLIVFILGIIGIALLIYIKKYYILLLLIPALNLIIYPLTNYAFFIPYPRSLLYVLIGISVIAGIPLGFGFKNMNTNALIKNILFFLIIISCFVSYYDMENNRFLRTHYVTEDRLDVLQVVKSEFGENNTIFVSGFDSFLIYPFTKNELIVMPPSTLIYGDRTKLIASFFRGNCETKEKILIENNIDLVILNNRLSCDMNYTKINKYYVYSLK
jgi:hypothetical protein